MATKKKTTRSTKAPRKNAVGGELRQPKPTKRTRKTTTKTEQAQQPAAKQTPPATNAKLSLLDAAHQILVASDQPLTTKQIIEQAADQQLWSSPNGKTPHNTLYAALLREINVKGEASRFAKVDRGLFAIVKK